MLGQFVIVLSPDYEIEFDTVGDAQDFLDRLSDVERAHNAAHNECIYNDLEIREVAYHYNTNGMPIRYFVD